MADFSQYFKQLYYGLWFKKVKIDTALDIPEGAVDDGNLRINGNLEVKVNNTWGPVQASNLTIDPAPAGGSGNVPSSGGTFNAIAGEASARIAADVSLQTLITAEAQARQAADLNNTSALTVEKLARQAADTATITTLRDGVAPTGDTLQKLYNLIISGFSEITVADNAARDAYNVKIGDHVFVVDDGDTHWALYKATTAGVGATYVKLSDPDLLGASMNAAAIKTAYESNADTNAFTNALLAKLNSIDASGLSVATANIASLNQALLTETSNRQSADSNLQGEINALRLATGTGSSSPINNITTTNIGNDYSGTIAVTITGYVSGMIIEATINASNTGPATLNINNLGAVGILKDSTTPVSSGDLIENKIYLLGFDGTNFQILSGSTPDLSGIAANTAAIAAEVSARQSADTGLQNNITAETTARQNGDSTLQSNINTEATARADGDQNLQIQINSLSTSSGGNLSGLQSEITARQNADSVLQNNIDAEASARAAGDTNTISTLRDGVAAAGDTLQKLYNLVVGGFSEITVANISARDAYNVKIGDHIFVTDDGDGRWALYKATTAGANATYVKLSDPDLLGATMSASQIKASYESNPDTNAFTNALLAKLNAISGNNTGDQDISGIATNAAAIVTESNNRQNADTSLQNNITAEATARANADTTNATAIATETTNRTNANTTLQSNITAEATARANADTALQNADTTLQTNITAEATARGNADINLQNQINNFTSVPKATIAEINAGTVDTKYPSPLGLQGSKYQTQDNSKLFVITSNTGNAYTASLTPAITAYTTGLVIFVKINAGNSAAATLAINGLAAVPIFRDQTNATQSADLIANRMYLLIYDGTNFQIINYQTNTFPTVTTGEKVLSITSAGPQKTYDLQDQVVSASSLTTADFSSGIASVTGFQGQYSYDNNYRYDCVGINQWRRAALNGNLVDLYLADIDDTAGAKTSSQLNTTYSTAVVGQRVWGTLYLYEKKTATLWKKMAIADA